MRALRHFVAGLVMLVAAAPEAEARAQGGGDKAVAQALFDEALKLMKDGKPAEACPKLAKSQELDPGMGTLFRLGECYEQIGRVASAWALFIEVAEDAKRAGSAPREAQARRRADTIAPRVPKLTVRISEAAAGAKDLRVTRDGAKVDQAEWGVSLPVDPGQHVIAAEAPGKKRWEQQVKAEESGTHEVVVPPLDNDVAKPPPIIGPGEAGPGERGPHAEGAPGTGQRAAAVAASAVGVVGVTVGVVFGVMAKSQWDDTLSNCHGGDTTKCDATGIELGGSAKRSAVISTIALGAGGAGLAAGIILWLTAPSASTRKASGARAQLAGRHVGAPVHVLPLAGPGIGGGVARWRF
jgi:hypothetical protein